MHRPQKFKFEKKREKKGKTNFLSKYMNTPILGFVCEFWIRSESFTAKRQILTLEIGWKAKRGVDLFSHAKGVFI